MLMAQGIHQAASLLRAHQASANLAVLTIANVGQVRYWNYNRKKKPWQFIQPVVPLDKLSISNPVSASLAVPDTFKERKFEWDMNSLNSKGFLRYQKPYKPPVDAKAQVVQTVREVIPELSKVEDEKTILNYKLSEPRVKFELLKRAFNSLNHSVPNSMMYMMDNIGDVVKFYTTEVKTGTPFDALLDSQANNELPPNLHVQSHPVRWNPEIDTIGGGLTAFPKSSTIVTGLRAKKKYRGFEAKRTWP